MSGPAVEHFDIMKDITPGNAPGFIYPLSDALFFSSLKKDSATAISRQLPIRLMLGDRFLA